MKEADKKRAAKNFSKYWKDKGYEKGQCQSFWIHLLEKVFGVEDPESFIEFELPVKLDKTKYIDAYIPSTQVLIEQKSKGVDLSKEYPQSGGRMMTPYRQAREYAAALPHDKNPRWIIVCNFHTFELHDMNHPNDAPDVIHLSDFEKEYQRLQFLVEEKDEILHREYQVSMDAGRIVGELYNALLKQYGVTDESKADEGTLKSLNRLCVRLVFCLYAEDAGIFGGHNKFHDYIKKAADKDIYDVREALINLFEVLNQPYECRNKFTKPELLAFPYVNGGLFEKDDSEIPNFTHEIVDLLLHNASEEFDWSQISPTIFGALFESTLNPVTRRKGGMHYTPIENIHKVIDPLFLNELTEELEEISAIKVEKPRTTRLNAFRKKLGSLVFFDPACGSGNFLTETYLSLRRLENKALELIKGDQITLELVDVIKVSIGQFYGIEINDFAVTVARTALWIAESQMMKETEELLEINLDFLPLKSYPNIVEGNALRMDWETVVLKDKLNYIIGNPPFVGTKYQTKTQKDDILQVSKELKKLDYVTGWYKKAVDMIENTKIECAFVSTNSITQGEQVAPLWKLLKTHINFAHKTFKWDSKVNNKAQVHCVIIGFSDFDRKDKTIYNNGICTQAKHINGYLIDAPDVFIETRNNPLYLCAPKMSKGSQPTDGGNLLLSEEERIELICKNPLSEKYIKRYMGANDLINNSVRYCLWLVDVSPNELRQMPEVLKRLEKVKETRKSSQKLATQKWADTPYLFTENRQPKTDYLMLPVVSSEKRKYIPVCYVTKDVIANANAQMIPNANLYTFGIINSNVHNAWMKTVCGRLKSDYAYSATIVYNNFPWPTPTTEQKAKIEQAAQRILDARALYPDCSLADLYDNRTMPQELSDAHKANDKAVEKAYGFKKADSESEIVAKLMKMYQQLLEGETSGSPKRHSK